jgi:hypothetical protein
VNLRLCAVALLVLATGGACKSKPREVIVLSTARVAADFDTYTLRRVGLVPIDGALDGETREALHKGLYAELSRGTPYELVPLTPADLGEVKHSEPLRRGTHRPDALIEIGRRFRLDAVVFSHVPIHRSYAPLEISLLSELVSIETGQVIWSASVHLDAKDERVRHGLEAYYAREAKAENGGTGWELALLSPARFARYAAFQIALQL